MIYPNAKYRLSVYILTEALLFMLLHFKWIPPSLCIKKTYEGFTCKHSGIDYTRSCMGKQNTKIYSTSCTLKHRLEQGISHTHEDSTDYFHWGKQNSFFLLWSFWYLANANKPQWEQFEDESIRKTLST